MKFFHTADWHLGKLVQGKYMTEDQRYVLRQLIAAVEQEKPDAVIIAGDLYDRAVPPAEAVELLDEVLAEIIIRLHTPVIAISGNHDSPDRLNFGTRLMEQRGLYLAGQLKEERSPVILSDSAGEIHIHLIPFADPAQVRHVYGDDNIKTHDDAMAHIIASMEERMMPGIRQIAVAHAFVTPNGEKAENTSDSERPLSIGGTEQVNAKHFKKFHYTALGHLHQSHYVGNETIRYAGSPLKYSISEEKHLKSFTIVEMDAEGNCCMEKRELVPLYDMRRIQLTPEELERQEGSDDYMFVTLLSDNPVLFPMEKTRAVFPNAMHVERRMASQLNHQSGLGPIGSEHAGRKATDPIKLFAAFYEEVKGVPLSASKEKRFTEVFSELLKEEKA